MATVAKMTVISKTEHSGAEFPPEHFEEDHWFQKDDGGLVQDCGCETPNGVQSTEIVLSPVYSTEIGSENHLFWMASPSGELRMQIENRAAARYFEVGTEYFIEIRKSRS